MSEKNYDVVVIGGGPGGYVAAIRAAQLGLSVACVDKWKNPKGKNVFGGTCLNVGCIPSKALLESSYHVVRARQQFAEHGIRTGDVEVDIATMQKRKDKIVQTLVAGVSGLFKKNKVDALFGAASLRALGDICEVTIDGGATLSAKNIIIATGSSSRQIPPAPVDDVRIVDNVGALEFSAVPKKLGVIGAGVIGLELGSVWRRLGSEVTILEALPEFLSAADADVAAEAAKIFKKQGMDIRLGARVTETKADKKGDNGVTVRWEKDGKTESDKFDKLIVAVGRVPHTEGLNAEGVGLQMDGGRLVVDAHCRTAHPNVFAIGDVVRGPMLAHKAEDEGVMVAELIAGQKPEMEYENIPWVIYTHPEIAWAGKTEQQLKQDGVNYRKGAFPFLANGRARGLGETEGFVKLLADAETDRLLGAHIIGAGASDLIAEGVLALEMAAASEDIARTCHAHPTLAEAFREAALAVDGRAIHI